MIAKRRRARIVGRSVPGALRHFLPTDQQLVDMARAKINAAIAERKAAADTVAPRLCDCQARGVG